MIQNFKFINWAGNIIAKSKFFAQPESEQEIISLVQQFSKIRLVGSAHSWSDHFTTDELLLNLDKYNRVLELNEAAKTIKVQAGIKLWQLNNLLDNKGLALINLGSIDKQSLAGAIATGTHGTGINFQCLASQVLEFSLITATGEKLLFKKGDLNFDAAVIHLGTLGVVSEITLQLTDAFNLHDQTFTLDFELLIERLDEFVNEHDHFKIWWLPPSKKAVVYTYKRTQEKRNDSRFRQVFNDQIISVLGYRLMVMLGNLNPNWRKPINALLTSTFDKPLNRIEKSYKVFRVPEPPKHRETEWAFDAANAKQLLTNYRKLFTETNFTFNFIQEIRFTKADNFWLSECHGRNTIWIGAYNHLDKQWSSILSAFEQFAMQHGGRPHWGKEFNATHAQLAEMYPKFNEFIAMKKSIDPSGKFSNHFTEKIFGC